MNAWWSLPAGLLVGLVYFGGLWWTIGATIAGRRPVAWMLLSRMVRLAVVVGWFVVAARFGFLYIFGSLVGFCAARTWLIRRLGGLRYAQT